MRPRALEWSVENCTIGRTMAILGERWSIVVLREVFNGIFRFDDMRERTGIPRQVLTNRLGVLVDNGILRRVPYREPGARARDEYRLTEKGFDLYPVLVAVREWGDRYLADPAGPPLETVHRGCGAPVRTTLVCDDGHAELSPATSSRGRAPARSGAWCITHREQSTTDLLTTLGYGLPNHGSRRVVTQGRGLHAEQAPERTGRRVRRDHRDRSRGGSAGRAGGRPASSVSRAGGTETLLHLGQEGCNLVQGFCISKPLPADEFADRLAGAVLTRPGA